MRLVPEAPSPSLLAGEFFEPDALARELNVSPRTIARWHARREGPPRVKQGRTILYRKSAVIEWLQSRERAQPRARPR
jgi:predicted DNA-binding transcriptional regulator AlpA